MENISVKQVILIGETKMLLGVEIKSTVKEYHDFCLLHHPDEPSFMIDDSIPNTTELNCGGALLYCDSKIHFLSSTLGEFESYACIKSDTYYLVLFCDENNNASWLTDAGEPYDDGNLRVYDFENSIVTNALEDFLKEKLASYLQ